jgi:hypothetical protein
MYFLEIIMLNQDSVVGSVLEGRNKWNPYVDELAIKFLCLQVLLRVINPIQSRQQHKNTCSNYKILSRLYRFNL